MKGHTLTLNTIEYNHNIKVTYLEHSANYTKNNVNVQTLSAQIFTNHFVLFRTASSMLVISADRLNNI